MFFVGDSQLHIASYASQADVITTLTLPLTKPEAQHPYFKCPYKSLPQDNVKSLNHDGRSPLHLAAENAHSVQHQEAIAALHVYAQCNMDYRVRIYFSSFIYNFLFFSVT